MQIILLSGGSGTRLWPLSNNSRSKQFLKVLRNSNGKSESMVQRTYRKISSVAPTAKITIATCATQVQSIAMQLEDSCDVVVEPSVGIRRPLSCLLVRTWLTEKAFRQMRP